MVFLTLNACGTLSISDRRQSAREDAAEFGWEEVLIVTDRFDVLAYVNANETTNKALTIYIEGDGRSWIDGLFPSDDPTPINLVALQLAVRQPRGAVAYLARPCQFVGIDTQPMCNKSVWTGGRFSEDVVASMNQAVDLLKQRFGAESLTLVGYSGGATVALLLAARRTDVRLVVGVAGNVNHKAWAAYHRLKPLEDSLPISPSDSAVAGIQQIYFFGGRDKVIPPSLVDNIFRSAPGNLRAPVIQIPDADHFCCWVDYWPMLWEKHAIRESESPGSR